MNKIELDLKEDEMDDLRREVGMMHAARTSNEIVELEIEAIDQLAKRGEYK